MEEMEEWAIGEFTVHNVRSSFGPMVVELEIQPEGSETVKVKGIHIKDVGTTIKTWGSKTFFSDLDPYPSIAHVVDEMLEIRPPRWVAL